ncbi:MAG TPA: metalloregulator ArsR/SmtB family transcription factor [Baekduia sp.]|uniref:ArsR/SmtB family transcription factor n=1 Tax=Baekduia sp. TaxID=2600305 RepID=UPI002D7679CF|nr:metalloregulator ArsR/SmtB family transcription factor [Baekduia sp.]HET6507618.1 metalloregulator ArsR/SmtB family transcription factor [Baekduia sp.]
MSTALAPGFDEELWAAVGDPSRRRVLDALLTRGTATPTALADDLPLTRQAVTKHLAVLDRAGLVTARRHGREVRFAVQPARLDEATRALTDAARAWDRRLLAIKRIAEELAASEAGRAED